MVRWYRLFKNSAATDRMKDKKWIRSRSISQLQDRTHVSMCLQLPVPFISVVCRCRAPWLGLEEWGGGRGGRLLLGEGGGGGGSVFHFRWKTTLNPAAARFSSLQLLEGHAGVAANICSDTHLAARSFRHMHAGDRCTRSRRTHKAHTPTHWSYGSAHTPDSQHDIIPRPPTFVGFLKNKGGRPEG